MTWAAFNTLVRVHLGTENRRQGIQTWIDDLILVAVLDLQSSIPAFRVGHTQAFAPNQFSADGFAAKAYYGIDGIITSAYVRDPSTELDEFGNPDTDDTWRTIDYRPVYADRDLRRMQDGLFARGERLIYAYPTDGTFWVVPSPIDDTATVTIVWDGVKNAFLSGDTVPFDERAAMAVGDFVLSRIARKVERDMAAAESYYRTYLATKRRIYSDKNEVAVVPGRSHRAGTQNSNFVPSLNMPSGVDAAITSWAQLAAVVTTNVNAGWIKIWIEASTGLTKVTQLRASTAATDTANGIQRGNDFDSVTNAKAWFGS